MIHDSAEPTTEARCPRCGSPIAAHDRYCPGCGAARPVICPTCGAKAIALAQRCPECGGPLPTPRPLLESVAGTEHAPAGVRRGTQFVAITAASLLLVFGIVALIYFTSPDRQADHPVARISAHAPLTLAIQDGTAPVALIGTANGVLASGDQGSTWQKLAIDGGVKAIGVSSGPSPTIYLAGAHFWRGNPDGVQQIATNLPASEIQALAVDPADPRRVYAAVAGRGLYQSTDGGQHWSALGTDLPDGVTSLVVIGSQNPLFFVATRQHGIFGSTDGQTWTNANGYVNGALPSPDVLALAYDPHSGDHDLSASGDATAGALYAGTDRGLFKTTSNGQTWGALPFAHPIVALGVTRSGDHLMLAVDSQGNVYRSHDGGVTWK